ncbi:18383_t:CDS:2, partial [Entrophospora sp. SA101]
NVCVFSTILYPSASRLFSSTNTRNYETPTYPASKYDTNAIQSYLEWALTICLENGIQYILENTE